MLPVHYKRFSDGAGIGHVTAKQQRKHFAEYKDSVEAECFSSTEEALHREIGFHDIDESWQGINVMTDARHGWRKNAKDTSVVAIGESSHRVLQHVHITKDDDHCTQRHEALGTKKVYEYFDSQNVSVAVHIHDRNMAINKLIRDSQPMTINQNDTWHYVKALKKSVARIGGGAKYQLGKAWHWQLEDKAEPVATHAHWAIRNCGHSVDAPRSSLLNIMEHYKNKHEHCHQLSRCKTDANYEPSRHVITDSAAERLLTTAITKFVLYTGAQDYILAKDSYHVESFNNTMNIFHDKRIAFGNEQYNAKSNLAVCHWNENVDREYTSM